MQNGEAKIDKTAPPNGQNGNQNGQNGFPQNEIKTESAKLYQNGIKPKRIQNGFETEPKRKQLKRKRKTAKRQNGQNGKMAKRSKRKTAKRKTVRTVNGKTVSFETVNGNG